MNLGWVGLGKLGLPCALVLASSGHRVTGYDVNPAIAGFVSSRGEMPLPWVEPGVGELLADADLHLRDSVGEVVAQSDIVFVAVQTPHAADYGGEVPAPQVTRDFEYGYLVQAVRGIAHAAELQRKQITLVVVSTVLPGTTRRVLHPQLNDFVTLVYSPQFIAMGTAIRDFRTPEFLLLGTDDVDRARQVAEVFDTVHHAERLLVRIEDAELAKVAYNTFISLKIVWANHLAQICDGVGADVDTVVRVLGHAGERLISTAYMRAGMGDGGACHPRDLIALADLEQRLNVPGFYAYLTRMREMHTQRLAALAQQWAGQSGLPITVLGKTYKPNVVLTAGSPALLLAHYLDELGEKAEQWDPLIDKPEPDPYRSPQVFVIATNHPQFHNAPWPPGSVVIDPWGLVADRQAVTVIRMGRH